MSDNPIEAAANELKKWLEQLKKIKDLLDSMEKAKIAEQKAIGDKALTAHKEMVQKAEWTELRKQQAEALKMAKESNEKLKDLEKAAPSNNPDVKNTLADADQTIKAADQDIKNSVSQDQDLAQGQGQGDLKPPTFDDHGLDPEAVDVGVPSIETPGAQVETSADLDMSELNEIAGPKVEKAFDGAGLDIGGAGGGLAQGLQKGVEGLQKGVEGMEKGIQGLEKGIEGAGKQTTGEAIGWKKGEKGWENSEGLSVKELGKGIKVNADAKVNIGSAGLGKV